MTTACSHVFCRSCLVPWLERSQEENLPDGVLMAETVPKCPTCNQNLLFSSSSNASLSGTMMVGSRALLVQSLERCQPLAHRVLKRIKVQCPLHEASLCSWSGDYGDLQDHLLSPSAHLQKPQSQQSTAQSSGSSRENDTETEPMDVEDSQAESLPSSSLERVVAVATSFKEQGNDKFATKHYQQARELYTKAITIMNQHIGDFSVKFDSHDLRQLMSALYCNRAACHHGLNDFSSAAQDASAAISIDPQYAKAYLRKAKSLIQIADFSTASLTLTDGVTSCKKTSLPQLKKELARVNKLSASYEKSLSLLDEGEFASAKAELGSLLRETTAPIVLLQTARADLGMGLIDSANRFCMQALRNRQRLSGSAEPFAYFVQGQCKILSVNEKEDTKILDSGVSLLRHVLKLDPDSKLAITIKPWLKVSSNLKKARQDAFSRKFDSALELYSTCIQTAPLLNSKAPLYSTLHTERAQVLQRLKRYDAALQDVALVVYNREDHVAAWMVRFACLHAKGQHETVLEEVQDLLRRFGENDSRMRQAYEKADFEVRKARRPDFYKMLNVSSIASEREIKKAYRQVAKDMHPDRFARASEADRAQAQRNFQALSEGLEILTDDFQRKLYDEGYDVESIKERVQAAENAAHRSNQYYHRHGHGGYHGGH